MDPLEKNCAILFDEMAIDSRIVYDNSCDIVRGPHKQAQVVMVRSITSKWKQPIMLSFDTPVTPTILFDLVRALERLGYPVRAVVSDMGPKNMGLWKTLNIAADKETGIQNPCHPERHIWFFADVPHVLKNIRNHVLDDGLYLPKEPGSTEKVIVLDKLILQELIKVASGSEFKMCFKLTDKHITAKHADRQNVRLAAQLLSNSTAAAIRELFEDEEAAAEVCATIDAGFDVLNSRCLVADKPLRCAFGADEHWEDQKLALQRLAHLMLAARFGDNDNLLPCQKGMVVSIQSALSLFEEMLSVAGFRFLFLARLNQDDLESFFSCVRTRFGSNVNPSPVELIQRVRLLLIGADPAAARGTAVQPESCAPSAFLQARRHPAEDAESVSASLVVRVCETAEGAAEEEEPETELEPVHLVQAPEPPPQAIVEELELDPAGDPTEVLESQAQRYGMAYAAGFLASKCARLDPSLGARTADAIVEEVPDDARWIRLLSRGGLTVPTRQWLGVFQEMEATFRAFHQGRGLRRRNNEPDNLSREAGVVHSLVAILCERWPQLDSRVVTAYAQLRTRFRLRYVAQLRRRDHAEALEEAAARRSAAGGAR
ncbi:Transposable element P transposase [Amphibalanus amphitrite]|uniref:Transposable element P transposase n=1 Tax=Amphibalanus amphitrite TaxID=1232801 RepID=A0A6A4WBD0_AMPAM|nr:Transposable element P transposase [Amphibalanus amphitrite]